MVPDALAIAYADLAGIALSLDEDDSWLPTGCAGWAVRDLVQHLLTDAQRALVALATPATGPADKNAHTYWLDSPGAPDADSRGIRATRTMASQWRLDYLTRTFADTAAAVLVAADRSLPADVVRTQGHVLAVTDLLATLVVEATIHHLDLVTALERPGPGPQPMAATRDTLDGLLFRATPRERDSASWIRAATGRGDLLDEHRRHLGPDARRLPLLC